MYLRNFKGCAYLSKKYNLMRQIHEDSWDLVQRLVDILVNPICHSYGWWAKWLAVEFSTWSSTTDRRIGSVCLCCCDPCVWGNGTDMPHSITSHVNLNFGPSLVSERLAVDLLCVESHVPAQTHHGWQWAGGWSLASFHTSWLAVLQDAAYCLNIFRGGAIVIIIRPAASAAVLLSFSLFWFQNEIVKDHGASSSQHRHASARGQPILLESARSNTQTHTSCSDGVKDYW